MKGHPEEICRASFSVKISQIVVEVIPRFFKALMAYSLLGPPGSLPLARMTTP